MKYLAALCAPLALAACAETQEPDPTPAEDGGGYNMVEPVPTPVSAGGGVAEGAWSRGNVEGRQAILFGPAGGEPVFAMFCDERDGIVLERRGIVPTGEIDMMALSVGEVRRSLAVVPRQQGDPALRAAIPFNDDLITRLQQGPSRIGVEVGEGEPLVLPPSPAVPELVTACRTRERGGSTAGG